MSTSGGHHEYTGECSVHRGDIMSTSRDVQYTGGYHEYIGGCSAHRGDIMSTSGFPIETERLLSTCSPTCIMISPDVLNIPDVLMISPDVLNTPRCTKHPPMY